MLFLMWFIPLVVLWSIMSLALEIGVWWPVQRLLGWTVIVWLCLPVLVLFA